MSNYIDVECIWYLKHMWEVPDTLDTIKYIAGTMRIGRTLVCTAVRRVADVLINAVANVDE